MTSSRRSDRSRSAGSAPGPRWGRIALVVAGSVVLVAVLAWGALAAFGAAGRLLSPDKPVDPVSAAPPASTTPSSAATSAAVATGTPGTADASASAEATATTGASGTPEAVAKAAVRFPDAPAVEPQVIRKLHPRHKYVAITIDDGLSYDPRLLKLLEDNHIRVTTFLLGQAVKKNPAFVKRLNADGFEIANHTWDHANLKKLSESGINSELEKTQTAISAVTGNQAPYMRPPGGNYDTQVKTTSGALGYKLVMWSRSFADTSRSATPEQLYKNVMDGLKPGEIILCHWKGKDTYEAMVKILPELKRRGFGVVTISQLIADSPGGK